MWSLQVYPKSSALQTVTTSCNSSEICSKNMKFGLRFSIIRSNWRLHQCRVENLIFRWEPEPWTPSLSNKSTRSTSKELYHLTRWAATFRTPTQALLTKVWVATACSCRTMVWTTPSSIVSFVSRSISWESCAVRINASERSTSRCVSTATRFKYSVSKMTSSSESLTITMSCTRLACRLPWMPQQFRRGRALIRSRIWVQASHLVRDSWIWVVAAQISWTSL